MGQAQQRVFDVQPLIGQAAGWLPLDFPKYRQESEKEEDWEGPVVECPGVWVAMAEWQMKSLHGDDFSEATGMGLCRAGPSGSVF